MAQQTKRQTLIAIEVALASITIGVFFFIIGVLSDRPSSTVADMQISAIPVSFTSLVHGTRSEVTRRVNYFITSSVDLKQVWKMVDAVGTPPKVDFKKNSVIAVFAGPQPTAGYAIKVSKVIDSNTRLVSITIEKPDGGCKPKAVATMPYELVAVPATTLPLAHEDISTTVSCPK